MKRNGKYDADDINRVALFQYNNRQESFNSPIDRRSDYYRQKAWHTPVPSPSSPSSPSTTSVTTPLTTSTQTTQIEALFTIPNILTITRVCLVFVFVITWYSPFEYSAICSTFIFALASFTDCLDGFLARKLKLTTAFGAFLDPVADKLMVSAAIILLTINPPSPLSRHVMAVPVLIMIGREITMSSLREWAASASTEAHEAVKVNSFGKWKTALQFLSITILIGCRDLNFLINLFNIQDQGIVMIIQMVVIVTFIMFWTATCLAVTSLTIYMSNVWSHFNKKNISK